MIDVFVIIGVLMVGIVGLLYVIVCFFIVFCVKDMCILVVWIFVFIVIVYIIVFVVVLFVCVNMIDIINGKDGSGIEYVEVLVWVKNWERIGLIIFNDKSGDGKMFYLVGKIDDLNSVNEVKVDCDIMVFVNFEIVDLLVWVVVLVVVGGIVVVLLIIVGLLLVILILVLYDLLKCILKLDISDK